MSLWDNETFTQKATEKLQEKENSSSEMSEEENEDESSSEDEKNDETEHKITLGEAISEEEDSSEDEEEKEKKLKSRNELKQMSLERHTSEAERTVFIANVSIKAKPAEITKFLKQFGKLVSYRLRTCAFRSDNNDKKETSKKVKFLKKQYSQQRKTQNCYAVYSTKEEAESAAEKINGQEFLGFHLRADWEVNKGKMRDIRNTIFVGNLPFGAEEEEIREFFGTVGEIKRVKLVRDTQTGMGKGIGYVTFVNKDDVVKGLDMIGDEFKGRLLRVEPCHKNQQKRVERQKQWVEKKLKMKREKKRVYKETVKANMGKIAKKQEESKPKKAKK